MATLPRIKGIPQVGNEVPPEVRKHLQALRESVNELNGSGLYGAIRYADFLRLLKESLRKGGVLPSSPPGGVEVPNISLDPFFNELKKQLAQAQDDIARMFAGNAAAENILQVNLEETHGAVLAAQQQAQELTDLAADLAQAALDLLDLATEIDAVQVSVADVEDGLLATSTLLDATVVRVDNTEDSIDVITAQITSLEAELIDTTALDPGIVWQFEGDDDDWTSNATLTTNNFYIRVGAFSGGYFRSPSGIAIDGALYSRIVARVRRVSGTGWLGRASYATSGGSAHGIDTTNYHLTLAVEPTFAGGGWVIVVWDMEILTAGGTDWVDNIIHQIQLELPDDGSTIFEYDWVAIARVAPSFVAATVAALESRVTATEDAIVVLSAATTSLEAAVDDLEGDVSANTTAISALTTRVDVTEDDITALSASVTSLDSRLDSAEANITATSSAVSGLTTTVTSHTGSISSHASQLTSLDARLDAAEADLAADASAISSLNASVSSINGTLTSQGNSITALNASVSSLSGTVTGQGSAITNLTTRVTTAEGTITSHTSSITALNTSLTTANTNIATNASAISNLTTQVNSVNGVVTGHSASITMLQLTTKDANKVNPLTSLSNTTDWTNINNSVVSYSLGGRSGAAGRIRTSGNVQAYTGHFPIDPRSIYEVRFSVLKNLAHAYIYIGLWGSQAGGIEDQPVLPIKNRAISAGAAANQYWTLNPALFTANTWYDCVFYILGQDVDPALCPAARVNDLPLSTQPSGWQWSADGYRLQPGSRFAALRVLNYANSTQTDLYVTDVSVTRLDNQRTAAITEEASIRSTADGLLSAEKTIKIDVNGYVTGYGLLVESGASGPVTSSFNILADRLNFAMPGMFGPTPVFSVGNVNGVPTFGLNGNLVVDGTIAARHIIAETVRASKMAFGQLGTIHTGVMNITAQNSAENLVLPGVRRGDVNLYKLIIDIDWEFDKSHVTGSNVRPIVQVWITVQWRSDGSGYTAQAFNSRIVGTTSVVIVGNSTYNYVKSGKFRVVENFLTVNTGNGEASNADVLVQAYYQTDNGVVLNGPTYNQDEPLKVEVKATYFSQGVYIGGKFSST